MSRVQVPLLTPEHRAPDVQKCAQGLDRFSGMTTTTYCPYFGDRDLGLIQRSRPPRECDELAGAVCVDDWVRVMLTKPQLNNVGNPVADSHLSIKTIKNNLTVLGPGLRCRQPGSTVAHRDQPCPGDPAPEAGPPRD